MLNLASAIKHCEEVAQENEKQFNSCPMKYDGAYANNGKTAGKCAEEHRQLAEWLKDYKRLLEQKPILDKIRAEIKGYRSTADKAISEDELTIEGMKQAYTDCLDIIDKYKAETEK